jgi:hypothetical protein
MTTKCEIPLEFWFNKRVHIRAPDVETVALPEIADLVSEIPAFWFNDDPRVGIVYSMPIQVSKLDITFRPLEELIKELKLEKVETQVKT